MFPEYDDPHSLIVLAEEEIVAIDLHSEGWLQYRPPYLCSLHSSAITAVSHVANVPEALWNKIVDVGDAQFSNYSCRDWPIGGGQIQQQNDGLRELLLTGYVVTLFIVTLFIDGKISVYLGGHPWHSG